MMKKMLCPYRVKNLHVIEIYNNSKVPVDVPEFGECVYDMCYCFTTHIAFDKDGHRITVPKCRRVQHDCEVK